jgi:hypothetical protein
LAKVEGPQPKACRRKASGTQVATVIESEGNSMVMIGKLTISQSASVQATQLEHQESVSNQPPQTAEASHVPTKAASSENTWQRAALKQDELSKKSVLTEKLTSQESYGHQLEQIKKNKEARDEKSSFSSLGSIFLGPLVGTAVGSPIAGKSDHENKKNDLRSMIETASEEVKKLQAELDEVYDSSFVATGNWFSGRDEGVEFQGESNVNQSTARKLTTKTSFGSDDDD